jgi:two-component system LytT family sensor kinase
MKVRWRQHELIFVTMLTAIAFAGYLWNVHNTTADQFAGPFVNNHVPFNLYRNVLLPDIGLVLLTYLAFLFINLFIIPRLLFPKKMETGTAQVSIPLIKMKISLKGMTRKVVKKIVWLILQLLLIVVLLGTADTVATYFKHEWQFHYPGFSIFFNKNIPDSQLNIWDGYSVVFFSLGLYALYVCVREIVINQIERADSRRDFRILICNKLTLFLAELILLPCFLRSFKLDEGHGFFIPYFSLVIPLFLVFMSNTYWLFPLKGTRPFLSKPILTRLLLSTFLYTLPFIFLLSLSPYVFIGRAFLVCWLSQLFILTPITWLAFQQKKDKILALMGAQKELVKSKANLHFLRSQINPHFLFNVLNTLYGTALQENADRTAEGIQKLGDMMRFMLHENNLDRIDMSREIDYLINYIALQKLRTQSSPEIIIEDNINEHNCYHRIAPMLLIPFVENAFKHGISLKEKSWIKISLHCNEKDILFEVRNSVHQRQDNDAEKDKSGIGFKNVLERLKLIYPGKFQIAVNDDSKEFFVQLSIQP